VVQSARMTYTPGWAVSQNAANACRLRETLSAPDLRPLSISVAIKLRISAAFVLFAKGFWRYPAR
jgi:hypothetical protein